MVATLTTTAAIMPAFLVAASSALIRTDLGLLDRDIGVIVGVFFGSQALTSTWGGRHAQRLGARSAMRTSAFGAAACLVTIPLVGRGATSIAGIVAVAGVFNGIAQPATSLALADVTTRPALTYSIKQASVPFATMIAGMMVPVVAVPFGWHSVFFIAALLTLGVGFAAGALPPMPTTSVLTGTAVGSIPDRRPLVALALAAGLGSGAATAMASYLVDGSLLVGMSVTEAGWLLSACGLAGIMGRLTAGWVSDVRPGSILRRTAWMLGVGAAGYPLLASSSPWLFACGALVIYGIGWSWSGILWYAVVRLRPASPAVATGIVAAGAAAGACLGPILFGRLLEFTSLSTAWLIAGVATLVGCWCAETSRVLFKRERLAAGA